MLFGRLGWALFAFVFFALITNWYIGLLILAIVAFHEQGHVWAMNRFKVPNKGFYLSPLGGVAIALGDPASEKEDFIISIMGPVWGCFQALVFFLLYLIFDFDFFMFAAGLAGLMNLFNLMPAYPLDGGRLVMSLGGSIHPKLPPILLGGSLVIALLLLLISKSIVLVLIVIYLGFKLRESFKKGYTSSLLPMKGSEIAIGFGTYLFLMVALLCIVASAFGLQVMTELG